MCPTPWFYGLSKLGTSTSPLPPSRTWPRRVHRLWLASLVLPGREESWLSTSTERCTLAL
ncbi:hypothetical protein Nmel_018723 [Mimus melanotis]